MKYLVVGAGGTGGAIAAFMTKAGMDVTVIVRGRHLEAIRENGMRMETAARGSDTVVPMKACPMEEYAETPDVIFVCVKGYSLSETIPFLQRTVGLETVVIPLLNLYGTGGRLQEKLPGVLVTDGCIYIAGEIKAPGTIWLNGDICKVVFGVRTAAEFRPVLEQVEADLSKSGIAVLLSHGIRRDALQKFAYVSPMAACGQYYDCDAGPAQKNGPERALFIALTEEIGALAEAMGIRFESEVVKTNLEILDALSPTASTSMQRDIRAGKPSELDGLVFEVVRLGRQYGVPVPNYEMVAKQFGFAG